VMRPWHARLVKIWRRVALRLILNGYRDFIPKLMLWVSLGTFTGGNTLNYFLPGPLKFTIQLFDPSFSFIGLDAERKEAINKRRRRRGKKRKREQEEANAASAAHQGVEKDSPPAQAARLEPYSG